MLWRFLGQTKFQFVPVLHRLQERFAAHGRLRRLLVVPPDIAAEDLLQRFTGSEVMALRYLFAAPLNRSTIPLVRGEFDGVERGTEPVALVRLGCPALAQAKEAIHERLCRCR